MGSFLSDARASPENMLIVEVSSNSYERLIKLAPRALEIPFLATMGPVFVTAGFAALVIVYGVYRRYTRISLTDVPGPDSASFIMGNMKELYQGQAAEADFKWQAQYGNVIRFKSAFGEDQLMISDPAALQYIFVKSGYRFPKQCDRRVLSQMINGKGIIWADGDDHKRQRRVMLPGFGAPESKAFLSLFKGCAESMSNKWTDIISNSKEQSAVLNVSAWLSRATLDAIGQGTCYAGSTITFLSSCFSAAFDIRFSSIDNNESALGHSYRNMMTDAFGSQSDSQIFFQGVSKYIPPRVLEYFANTSKNPRVVRIRETGSVATSVAKQMVKDKAEMLLQGKGSRDVFSLLVKANMDTDAKAKLTEEELFAQMRTILFAGHETTSNTVSFALLELAKHPEIQSRLRAEIWETEAAVHARGDVDFTIADFEAMTYTTAVMKEVLRYCCIVYHVHRYASQDDVLPLSQPITTRSGDVIYELPVPKGTRIVASIAAYNRNKELWGEDAHVFNPDRWLDGTAKEKKATSIGVYSNLMTFIGGVRACIGWRFAVIEIQAFLTEIVGKFEFAPTDKTERIRREACLVMTPTVAPRNDKEY
ncbi:cytochrome P450 [Suillus paluster]|uniref:cytochrome P450 n=1 Tax=Suillus paluster TaxID=48578 RepID=UPI001B879A68|nr:cytochrome P450 [Suillus paluster]KAG1737830.1 cytochrome P450 [Suillus paluster]